MPKSALLPRSEAEAIAVIALRQARREATAAAPTLAERYADNPVGFLRDVLGVGHIWPKMVEMCEAVCDNRRVTVVGANSSSKDFTAGRLICWWQATRYPAKAVIIGPTHRQVRIVWHEARTAYAAAAAAGHQLGGEMLHTPYWEIDDAAYAIGFSTSDEFNIAGHHSPHLLVLVTEAHAVEAAHFEAIARLNPTRLLLTGNPLVEAGEFYESHHGKRNLYAAIAISAFDTPNVFERREVIPGMVTLEDVEEHKAEWGEGSPLYVASVLGQFPASIGDRIVTLQHAMEAVERSMDPFGEPVLTCDVAGRGTDRTVFLRRDGPVARILRKQAYTDNLMETVGWIVNYCAEHPEIGRVVVDAVGIGFGVSSRLRELASLRKFEPMVEEFIGGGTPSDPGRFVDRNAEAWWAMREAFVGGAIDICNDSALIGQLTSRKYGIKSDRRIAIQPKAELAKSPDEADALAMSYALMEPAGVGVL